MHGRYAAPAGGGSNVSLLGGNFSFGDDYRVTFLAEPQTTVQVPSAAVRSHGPSPLRRRGWSAALAPSPLHSSAQATFVNDSLVVCLAPPYIGAQRAALTLTLNGQQHTAPPTSFPFFSVSYRQRESRKTHPRKFCNFP